MGHLEIRINNKKRRGRGGRVFFGILLSRQFFHLSGWKQRSGQNLSLKIQCLGSYRKSKDLSRLIWIEIVVADYVK